MSDEERDPMIDGVRGHYHAPPETPKEEMWEAIQARIRTHEGTDAAEIVDLGHARRARAWRKHGWIPLAAAALLVVGIGIGRVSAPVPLPPPAIPGTPPPTIGLDVAAREHLGRSESLLTMVRADARDGRIDPSAAAWARGLLTETRLLIDARAGSDPTMDGLLEDLELVLIQIVGVAEAGSGDDARTRTELELAISSLEAGEVLPRIRAALPPGLAGT